MNGPARPLRAGASHCCAIGPSDNGGGQVENQVQFLRGRLFVPKPAFADLDALNDWLRLRCEELANRPHPEQQDRTVAEVFEDERAELRPPGRVFDGYVEKTVRVRSTCLVQYASNRYSVPSHFAGQHVSLRAYGGRIVLVSGKEVIAEHKRRFTRNVSYFEPWHYVPLLDRKPGALRDGAPFVDWQLPEAMHRIREHYMASKGGDRAFVDLLLLAQDHGIEVVVPLAAFPLEMHCGSMDSLRTGGGTKHAAPSRHHQPASQRCKHRLPASGSTRWWSRSSRRSAMPTLTRS